MLLSPDVRRTHDEAQAPEPRIVELIVLEDRLERTALAAVVELHVGKTRGVEGRRALRACGVQQLFLGHEEKLRLWIDEPADQPWTGDAIDLHVASRDPLHRPPCESCSRSPSVPLQGHGFSTHPKGRGYGPKRSDQGGFAGPAMGRYPRPAVTGSEI